MKEGTEPLKALSPEATTTFELEHAHDISEELRLTVGGCFNMIDRLVEQARDEVEVPLGDLGRLRYFAGVKNLLDIQYRVPVATDISSRSAQQYGRSFMVEAALSC